MNEPNDPNARPHPSTVEEPTSARRDHPERDRVAGDDGGYHRDRPEDRVVERDTGRRETRVDDEPAQRVAAPAGDQAVLGKDRPGREGGDERRSSARRLGEPHDVQPPAARAGEAEQGLTGSARQRETASTETGTEPRAPLIHPDRAHEFQRQWTALKADFVDEPRYAVRRANQLVGEVLTELEELFRAQRAELEHGLDDDSASTEHLRIALGRYRSFFDRLLSF
jgi:hypothetical protein